MVLMNRVLVWYGEGLDSRWRSEVDRTVLQCYCITKARGNPSKRTNHGYLAGAHLHFQRPPRLQPTTKTFSKSISTLRQWKQCTINLVPLCSWQQVS